jgi:hypothetical protein
MGKVYHPRVLSLYHRMRQQYPASHIGSLATFAERVAPRLLPKVVGAPSAAQQQYETLEVRLTPGLAVGTKVVVDRRADDWYEQLCDRLGVEDVVYRGAPIASVRRDGRPLAGLRPITVVPSARDVGAEGEYAAAGMHPGAPRIRRAPEACRPGAFERRQRRFRDMVRGLSGEVGQMLVDAPSWQALKEQLRDSEGVARPMVRRHAREADLHTHLTDKTAQALLAAVGSQRHAYVRLKDLERRSIAARTPPARTQRPSPARAAHGDGLSDDEEEQALPAEQAGVAAAGAAASALSEEEAAELTHLPERIQGAVAAHMLRHGKELRFAYSVLPLPADSRAGGGAAAVRAPARPASDDDEDGDLPDLVDARAVLGCCGPRRAAGRGLKAAPDYMPEVWRGEEERADGEEDDMPPLEPMMDDGGASMPPLEPMMDDEGDMPDGEDRFDNEYLLDGVFDDRRAVEAPLRDMPPLEAVPRDDAPQTIGHMGEKHMRGAMSQRAYDEAMGGMAEYGDESGDGGEMYAGEYRGRYDMMDRRGGMEEEEDEENEEEGQDDEAAEEDGGIFAATDIGGHMAKSSRMPPLEPMFSDEKRDDEDEGYDENGENGGDGEDDEDDAMQAMSPVSSSPKRPKISVAVAKAVAGRDADKRRPKTSIAAAAAATAPARHRVPKGGQAQTRQAPRLSVAASAAAGEGALQAKAAEEAPAKKDAQPTPSKLVLAAPSFVEKHMYSKDLVAHAAGTDQEAFSAMLRKHASRVSAGARALLGDRVPMQLADYSTLTRNEKTRLLRQAALDGGEAVRARLDGMVGAGVALLEERGHEALRFRTTPDLKHAGVVFVAEQ